ncbi:cytochrome P450 [Qipengyuania sp. DGS5-3]|uniref:cytochrome P450 n=1 Tax=Qipengyuania sp. DGS5-3 TaxID=3349632 RepID=UPI0036D33550
MTSQPLTLPIDIARSVIAPESYAAWEPLLDTFDRLREEAPVARIVAEDDSFEPFWLITRYDDVMRISKDNKTFLNNPKPVVFATRAATEFSRQATGSNMLVDSLVVFDAPIHPKYRKLTQDWFMPRNLEKIESEIRTLANRRIDAMIEAGPEVDFVKLVAAPMPLHVIMQILGIPEEDEPRMLMLTQQMFGGQDADLSGSGMENMTAEQVVELVAGAVKSFEEYFAGIAAARRANPTDDVASVIANAKVDGEPLPDRDMAGYYIIMAAAGHDTTSATMSGAMLALARDREQFAKVKADRSLLPGLVEEAIRWTTAVQHFMRTAAEDVELGGQQVKAGDWMMLNYVAANHDPSQFDNPRDFDASRSPNRHMAFGAGAHQCLGLHLARLQIKVLFDALLDRLEGAELAGEPARSKSTFVGGLKTLPLRITAG